MSKYYASPETRILVEGLHVKEAYSIEWNGSYDVMAYKAWNSRTPEFANGMTLATGSLILNDISPNYINRFLGGTVSEDQLPDDSTDRARLKSRVEDITNKYLSRDLATNPNYAQQDTQAILEATRMYKKVRKTGVPQTTTSDVLEPGKGAFFGDSSKGGEFDIAVEISRGPYKSIIAKCIGCRFTGNSFLVQSESSQNLKKAYGFIAKSFTD